MAKSALYFHCIKVALLAIGSSLIRTTLEVSYLLCVLDLYRCVLVGY